MKKCIIALCMGLLITTSLTVYSNTMQEKVAQNVLRLHVLANSDEACDQNLKLKVRDRLLSESRSLFINCKTPEESKVVFLREKERLETVAEDEIRSNGFSYPVTLSLEKTFFPTKYYDGIAFPAGEYDAVRVEIGKAAGQNWWCVMFPPLCFVDGSVSSQSHTALSDSVGDNAPLLTPNASTDVQIRFKVVDFFQNATHVIKAALRRA
ncbi:MAG: stage II sporulation protein R [Clostridia bacterium]|nr:stage II sporulation protein R [Clostridia bacterium]